MAQAAAPDTVELLPLPEAVRDYPRVAVSAEVATLVGNGRVLSRAEVGFDGDGPWAVIGPDGSLLAMYEAVSDDIAKPAVVIA